MGRKKKRPESRKYQEIKGEIKGESNFYDQGRLSRSGAREKKISQISELGR
jgi:hypothetical protein